MRVEGAAPNWECSLSGVGVETSQALESRVFGQVLLQPLPSQATVSNLLYLLE